jgi:hypothetical protein
MRGRCIQVVTTAKVLMTKMGSMEVSDFDLAGSPGSKVPGTLVSSLSQTNA